MTASPKAVDCREQIERTAAALSLDLQSGQIDRLVEFVGQLQRWNAVHNLTAARGVDRIVSHHIADCLAAVGPLARQAGTASSARLLDVGSGGGLPGAVLAIALPSWSVLCLDAVGKKAAFTTQVAGTLGLGNLSSAQARVEGWIGGPFDVVCSRAFSSLARFVSATERLVAGDGVWMAMKGKVPCEELDVLPRWIEAFHVEQLRVPTLAEERCLVWMRRHP